jgi:nicotinamidase-related amidase
VVLARTEHARDRSTWTLNMLEDDEGFAFPGTAQAKLLEGLDTAGGIDVVKTRDSAFHGTRLLEVLREHDVGRLLLCGVSTHSCIAQTATTAFAEDLHAAVASDAVASEDPELAAAMLEFLDDEMRQPILQQDDAVAALRRGTLADEPSDQPADGDVAS